MRNLYSIALATGLAVVLSVATDKTANASADENASGPEIRGLLLPYINPARGRSLFASKGCVVCHSINGVGGDDAAPLDAAEMPMIMNPFDFAASMWRGAAPMIAMQEDELGEQIEFSGDELIDIIAFVHSIEEQKKFSQADIPKNIGDLMHRLDEGSDEHGEDKKN